MSDWDDVEDFTGKTTVRYEAPPKGKQVAQKPAAEPVQRSEDEASDEEDYDEEDEDSSEEEGQTYVPTAVVRPTKQPPAESKGPAYNTRSS